MKDMYNFFDGIARFILWLVLICSTPFAIIMAPYLILGTLTTTDASLQGIAILLFMCLVFCSLMYSEKTESPTYKFWLALFVRFMSLLLIVILAVKNKRYL